MDDRADQTEGQASELVERLARRFSEPVGVIDVRYAQQKYDRIFGWLVERFGLVDQLKARYGVEDAPAGDGQQMVMRQIVAEQIDHFSTSTQYFSHEARPSSFAEIVNTHSTMPDEYRPQDEGKFRVSRRPPPLVLKSETESPAADPTAIHPQSTGAHALPASEPVETIKQSGNVASASDTESPPSLVFKKDVIEREEKSQPRGATVKIESDSAASSLVTQRPGIKPAQSAPPETGSPSLVLQKSRVERLSQPKQESPTSAQTNEIKSERTKDDIQIAASSPTILSPTASSQSGAGVRKAAPPERSPVSSAPLISSVDQALPLAAPPAKENRPRESAERRIETTRAVQDNSSKTVVASEIRDDASHGSRPAIVWRKSSDSPTADSTVREPSAIAQPMDGQVDNSAFATARQQADHQIAPAHMEAPQHEIQIEQLSPQIIRDISERVIRTISFDLKVERERRGKSKWR